MSRAVGVLGGTFDPIHVGHLIVASVLAEQLNLDSVLFVPAGDPWQKSADRLVTSPEARLEMTVLATAPDERFAVSRVDIDRPGPTYAVDTLADVQAEVGHDAALTLIVGADALASMRTWREPERIGAMARIVGVTRPGVVLAKPDLPNVELAVLPGIDVSSSDIRARVAAGRSIRYLVPDAVRMFILDRGLYTHG